MIELQTCSSSENDKPNKRHKYTLNEALQVVLELNDESYYSDVSAQPEISFQRLQPTTTCFCYWPQKQLVDADVSNNYILFKSY